MTPVFAQEIVEALIAEGVGSISFTGGEPTLCWDTLMVVLKCCAEASVRTRMYSNGSGLTSDRIAQLEGLLDDVVISLDSQNPESVRSLRGSVGAIAESFDAVQRITTSKIRLFVISVCSQINLSELEPLGVVLLDLEIDGWWIQQFIPEGLGEKVRDQLAVSNDQFQKVIKCLSKVFNRPMRSFAANADERHRVFVNCYGEFVEYDTGTVLGTVLDSALRQQVVSSGEYKNMRRT
jgi:MoaA/NifB/PqqE/SkfB family radical SAM enzyme